MESAKKIGGRRRPAPTCGEVPASWLPEGTLQVPGAQEVLQTVPLPQIFLCGLLNESVLSLPTFMSLQRYKKGGLSSKQAEQPASSTFPVLTT